MLIQLVVDYCENRSDDAPVAYERYRKEQYECYYCKCPSFSVQKEDDQQACKKREHHIQPHPEQKIERDFRYHCPSKQPLRVIQHGSCVLKPLDNEEAHYHNGVWPAQSRALDAGEGAELEIYHSGQGVWVKYGVHIEDIDFLKLKKVLEKCPVPFPVKIRFQLSDSCFTPLLQAKTKFILVLELEQCCCPK